MQLKIGEALAVILLFFGLGGISFYVGMEYKEASMKAADAAMQKALEDTRKQAMEGAADAISKITVRNTTVQGKVETIIRDNPVYRDCQHLPEQLRNINEVLTGRAGPVGDRSLPGTDATH